MKWTKKYLQKRLEENVGGDSEYIEGEVRLLQEFIKDHKIKRQEKPLSTQETNLVELDKSGLCVDCKKIRCNYQEGGEYVCAACSNKRISSGKSLSTQDTK